MAMAEQFDEEFLMLNLSDRLKTFKDWPFSGDDCQCTPEKMAEAGFYHCPTDQEPDAARCCVCIKELDGWEPTDDPRLEHKKHSKDCPFLKIDSPADITLIQAMDMYRNLQKAKLSKRYEAHMKELISYKEAAIKQLNKLA